MTMHRFLLLTSTAVVASTSKPNFLFVLMDDIGWGDLSYNDEHYMPGSGGEKYTLNPARTPHIDAVAKGEGTMLFRRFYSGSAVCSPTRASILTGRTPKRSCIDGAEGCGQKPAWSCYGAMPLPPTEFTVAEALKEQGYATMFVGKWHLGDFWIKDDAPHSTVATQKWPSSHPGMHGFDEWSATEASASSSMPNCGCNADWVNEGQGCVTGHGVWKHKAADCTNYWMPTDLDKKHMPERSECHFSNSTTRDCVANLTSKIEGDDSLYQMDVFEDFLSRKSSQGAEASPWFVHMSIHTNHEPHPAMPEWYFAYNESEGGPAGDYQGTISQADHAIGRLMDILTKYNAEDNTMMWFTADNGPHTGGRPSGQNSATNGLRQCKASLFEGGIRVPGFVHWPQVIKSHVDTKHPVVTMDFLPTVLDVMGLKHPRPEWAADGISIAPLLRGDVSPESSRATPIAWALNVQGVFMNDTGKDGVWKMVYRAQKGQCAVFQKPYSSKTKDPLLFNLEEDPTESNDLCKKHQDRCDAMKSALDDFRASIDNSRMHESECEAVGPSPGPSPSPEPPAGGFELVTAEGECLTLMSSKKHGAVVLGDCDGGSKWDTDKKGHLYNLGASKMCLKLDQADSGDACADQRTMWIGKCGGEEDAEFTLDSNGHLVAAVCPDMCGVPATRNDVIATTSAGIALGSCDDKHVVKLSRNSEFLVL